MATSTQNEGLLECVKESVRSVLRLVPRGLTLGPSLAKDGQMGLWCVGWALKSGTLLGLEDPEKVTLKEAVLFSHKCSCQFNVNPIIIGFGKYNLNWFLMF